MRKLAGRVRWIRLLEISRWNCEPATGPQTAKPGPRTATTHGPRRGSTCVATERASPTRGRTTRAVLVGRARAAPHRNDRETKARLATTRAARRHRRTVPADGGAAVSCGRRKVVICNSTPSDCNQTVRGRAARHSKRLRADLTNPPLIATRGHAAAEERPARRRGVR